MKKSISFIQNYLIRKILLFSSISIFLCGCGINTALENLDSRAGEAIHSLDNAIAVLSQESADWQIVVTDLQSQLTSDIQSLIDSEVNNLMLNTVHSTGVELRCNAEYMRINLRRDLINIRNSLAESINSQISSSPFSGYEIPLTPTVDPFPYVCNTVPSALDMSLSKERRSTLDIYGFDLKSLPITVSYRSQGFYKPIKTVEFSTFARTMSTPSVRAARLSPNIVTDAFEILKPVKLFNTNIPGSISIISDFHAVINLTESGGNLPPNATDIVISCGDKILSEIPIITYESTLVCTTVDLPVNPGAITFTPPAISSSPYGGNPDKDFSGHGPCVTFRLNIYLNAARNKLQAYYYMDAWECPDNFDKIKKDYTQALGGETVILYEASEGEKILSFDVQPHFNDRYIDNDHSEDTRYFGGTAPVSKLEYVGDTKGSEAGTKTSVVMTFRTIHLQIEKCEYK